MKTRAFVEALSVAISKDLNDFKVQVNKNDKGVVNSVTVMFREKNDANGESTLGRYAKMCKLLEQLGSVMSRYSDRLDTVAKPDFMSDFAKFNKETRLVLDKLRKSSTQWRIRISGDYTYLNYTLPNDFRPIGGFMNDVYVVRESEKNSWISSENADAIIDCIIDDYIAKVGVKMKKNAS